MWRTEFQATGEDKKRLVKALEEATGEKAQYQGVPSCAYRVGGYTVTKDGNLEFENELAETEATDHVYAVLAEAGFKTGLDEEEEEETVEPETVSLVVSLPLKGHTGPTLRNLISLIYTRAGLLNKALGTSFRVDPFLAEILQTESFSLTPERVLKTLEEIEAQRGPALEGLRIEDDRLIFGSLPETSDPAVVRTFSELVAKMNRQALTSKRIIAKEITEPNERYALRIWLTRLGMNGQEFKEARAILMRNLTGNCAFHTPADQERWKKTQAEKRDALRAAKAAEAEAEEDAE